MKPNQLHPTKEPDLNEVYRDLDFYFNQFDAAIGFRSGQGSFESRAAGVFPVDPPFNSLLVSDYTSKPYSRSQLSKIHKYTIIQQTMQLLPLRTRQMLDSIYNHEYQALYPTAIRVLYGKKAGLVLFNSFICLDKYQPEPDDQYLNHHSLLSKKAEWAKTELIRFMQKRLNKKLTPTETQLNFEIGVQVDAFFKQIHQDYRKAKKTVINQRNHQGVYNDY